MQVLNRILAFDGMVTLFRGAFALLAALLASTLSAGAAAQPRCTLIGATEAVRRPPGQVPFSDPCVLWPAPAKRPALPTLAQAWDHYGKLNFEKSVAEASRVEAQLLQRASTKKVVDRLYEARLLRGLALLALQRTAEADASFRRAAIMAPERQPDAARIPPAARTRFEAIRSAVQGQAPVSMRIESMPLGARLSLDGTARGKTPQTLAASPGTHLLLLEKPGFPQLSTPIVFDGERPERVALQLEAPSLDALSGALGSGGITRAGRLDPVAVRTLERRRVGRLGQLRREGPGYVLELTDLTLESKERVELAAPLTWAKLETALRTAPEVPAEADRRWWRSAWLWVPLGVLAAGATATGLYFAFRQPAPEGSLRFVP